MDWLHGDVANQNEKVLLYFSLVKVYCMKLNNCKVIDDMWCMSDVNSKIGKQSTFQLFIIHSIFNQQQSSYHCYQQSITPTIPYSQFQATLPI